MSEENSESDSLENKLILDIDELCLAEEWVQQPRLYKYWADKVTKAQELLDLQESKVEYLKAKIADEIRSHPKEHGFVKKDPTEAAVKERIILDKRYQQATLKAIKFKKRVSTLKNNVIAVDHRKKALENIVNLTLSGFNAAPRMKGDYDKAAQEKFEQGSRRTQTSKANAKIKRRNKS